MPTTLLADIKTRIQTLSLGAWTTIRRGEMPPTPDAVICLFEYAGNPPNRGFGRPGLQYVNPGVQVKVRGTATDYDGPHAMIQTIFEDLVKVQDVVIGSTNFNLITANQTPFLLERDGNQRCVWAVNFICDTEVAP